MPGESKRRGRDDGDSSGDEVETKSAREPRERGEGKEVEETEETILQKALKYCWGDGFLDVFRTYFRKHAEVFEVMAEGKTEEHDLQYQELFLEYLGLFENTLEEFIEKEGSDINTFYEEVKAHKNSKDPQIQLFITCLLASADYDSFFKVMKKEAEKSLKQKRLDSEGERRKGSISPTPRKGSISPTPKSYK